MFICLCLSIGVWFYRVSSDFPGDFSDTVVSPRFYNPYTCIFSNDHFNRMNSTVLSRSLFLLSVSDNDSQRTVLGNSKDRQSRYPL